MTEAEILQLSFSANEAVSSLFSIFFGIVSAYIAGLFFFLHRSPGTLKVISFGLLTVGFLFLGQSMSGVELRILGLMEAWRSLGPKVTGIADLNQAGIPLPILDLINWLGLKISSYDGNRLGIYTGWLVALCVYLSLFYATFIYRWPARSTVSS